jgi:hypothetical protein
MLFGTPQNYSHLSRIRIATNEHTKRIGPDDVKNSRTHAPPARDISASLLDY